LGQLTWFDRTGKSQGVVGEPGDYSTFRLSPNGRRVAASLERAGSTNLWLLDVERGVAGPFTLKFGQFPVWSPDGRTIVFSSGGPIYNLSRKDSSGAGAEQGLTPSPNSQWAGDWSRDGRWLLYTNVMPDAQRDLWISPVTPEGKPAPDAAPKPYLRTPFIERSGRFSPEAPPRWVAYHSDETGRWEVYIQAFPEPRGATQISKGGGQYPQWGADAGELFYVSPDNKLMAVDLKIGADTVEPSTPRELFPLPAMDTGYCPYDTTLDGQRFLVRATPEHGASQPLTIIVNWPALLKEGKK
jgi:Tol biopolymer transport system component